MLDQYLPLHHLAFSPKNVGSLLARYTEYASECILRAVHKYDDIQTPLLPFLILPAYSSAALTLFGRSFDAEKSYEPFRRFDDYFHVMAAGVPRFMIPGAYHALNQVGKMFEDYLRGEHHDCSDFIQLLESGAKDAGWVRDVIHRF